MTEDIPKGEIRVDDCKAGEIFPGVRNWEAESFLIVKRVDPISREYIYAIGLHSGVWVQNPDFTVDSVEP